MKDFRKLRLLSPVAALMHNLLMVYVVYFLARIIYLL